MIRLTWLQFRPQATHGITPLGYAAFAFTLGVLIGRTVPAMAVALAVFAVIQIAMPLRIRPHLFPAATLPCRHTVIPVTALQDTSLTMRQPAQPRPSAPRHQCKTATPASRAASPATASRRRTATSPPAATGPSKGAETAIYLALTLAWPGTVSVASTALLLKSDANGLADGNCRRRASRLGAPPPRAAEPGCFEAPQAKVTWSRPRPMMTPRASPCSAEGRRSS